MNKTEHYDLNQWELHDRVMMQDFNADNAKIDTALKAEADARAAVDAAEASARQAADTAEATAREAADAAQQATLNTHAAQIAKLGNCQIYTTTYVGTGKYGANNKNTLSFPHKPLLVIICDGGRAAHLFSGCTGVFYQSGTSVYGSTVIWNGNTVSWSCSENATGQLNAAKCAYYVVALLVKE